MKRKCLILKDAQGGLCGYLMQEEGRIVLNRRSGADTAGTLVCIDSTGGMRRLTMEERMQEMQWPDRGGELETVYGERCGELLFVSGEDARRAYLLESEAGKAGEQQENGAPKEPTAIESTAAQSRGQEARWPPPPCLMGARYCGGVWRCGTNGEG